MNPDWRFDRRAFLRLLLSGLAAAAPAIGYGGESPTGSTAEPWRPPATRVELRKVLEAYFGDPDLDGAATLGRSRAMTFPDGGKVLQSRIADTIALIAEAADVSDACAILDRTVREDFEQLRLESLHGWQLAYTELDLCVAAWWLLAGKHTVAESAH